MPFEKKTSGKCAGEYESPSGRCFTKKQVEAYYATGGFKQKVKSKDSYECMGDRITKRNK